MQVLEVLKLLDWVGRHEYYHHVWMTEPLAAAYVAEKCSPDFLLAGEATGKPAPAIIALPDRLGGLGRRVRRRLA